MTLVERYIELRDPKWTRKQFMKVKNITLKDMKLLAPADGLCHKCAVDHAEEQPHNQQSLHWQYYFHQNNGRWPTWADAMAHCTPEVKAKWTAELAKHGITV